MRLIPVGGRSVDPDVPVGLLSAWYSWGFISSSLFLLDKSFSHWLSVDVITCIILGQVSKHRFVSDNTQLLLTDLFVPSAFLQTCKLLFLVNRCISLFLSNYSLSTTSTQPHSFHKPKTKALGTFT